jgi:parallel beta-helix repeat protein
VNKNLLLSALVLAILVCGLVLGCPLVFGMVQASAEVRGIIDSNTTWSKADSPFTLTGPILVDEGVTLVVEAGVTVDLNGYYIRVDGTLFARGSISDNIHFSGGGSEPPNWSIMFTENSTSWNEQGGSGCVLENVVIDSAHTGISIKDVTPKINNNSISAYYAIDVFGGLPVISNNVIKGAIGVHYASPTIRGNTITGSISAGLSLGQTVISNNIVVGGEQNKNASGIVCANAYVSGNIIYGFATSGITTETMWGHDAVIEENLIMFNSVGINISRSAEPDIRYNTVANNSVGIEINDASSPIIIYNNIQDNIEYSVYLLESSVAVDAADNWWGTTDYYAVRASIFDFNDDFNLGEVSFTPVLTASEPKVPSTASAPAPTPTPAPTRTGSPTDTSALVASLRDLEIAILALLLVIAGLLVVTIYILFKKNR